MLISKVLNQETTPDCRYDHHVIAASQLATSRRSASEVQWPMGKMDVAILKIL